MEMKVNTFDIDNDVKTTIKTLFLYFCFGETGTTSVENT